MKIAITPPASNLSATQLEILDAAWSPNVGLNFEYRLLNSANDICSARKRVDFNGADYNNWPSGDDAYVIQKVAAKLGLTVA